MFFRNVAFPQESVSAVGSPKMHVSRALAFSLKIAVKLCASQMVTMMFLTKSHMPSSLLPRVRLVRRGSESCSRECSCRRGGPRERVQVPRPSGSPCGCSASQMPGYLAGRAEHDYYFFLIWKEHKPRCFPGGCAAVSAETSGFRVSVSGTSGALLPAPSPGGASEACATFSAQSRLACV